MKKLLSFKTALKASLFLFGLLILFHTSIVIGILVFNFAPIEFLWGGRMENEEQLLQFEFISLATTLFCFVAVLIRGQIIKMKRLLPFSRVIMWLLFVLFLLNTVGNILAKSNFEKGFTILTLSLAMLCLRLALEPVKHDK